MGVPVTHTLLMTMLLLLFVHVNYDIVTWYSVISSLFYRPAHTIYILILEAIVHAFDCTLSPIFACQVTVLQSVNALALIVAVINAMVFFVCLRNHVLTLLVYEWKSA